MLSDDELQNLADRVSTQQVKTARRTTLLDSNSVLLPIGVVVAIIIFLFPGVWYAASTYGRFERLEAETRKLQYTITLQTLQIAWFRQVVGNPDGRWTYAMSREAFERLMNQNGLKPVDVDYIHRLHIQATTPSGDFPTYVPQQ